MARYLVVYASSEGQTKSVSERLGVEIRERGHDALVVDHRATGTPAELDAADAVVLAGSVHLGRVHRGLARFAARHAEALASRPSALVIVCLTASKRGPEAEATLARYVEGFLTTTSWQPDVVEFVAGALRPSRLGPLQRRIIAVVARQEALDIPSDGLEFTDWAALGRFAQTLSAWFPRVGVVTRAPGPAPRT